MNCLRDSAFSGGRRFRAELVKLGSRKFESACGIPRTFPSVKNKKAGRQDGGRYRIRQRAYVMLSLQILFPHPGPFLAPTRVSKAKKVLPDTHWSLCSNLISYCWSKAPCHNGMRYASS